MALQIWTMDADGSNKQQITNNGAANFGPYFFPDGNRIIFSSNLHDEKGRNFDLYSLDIDGSDLERITFFDGFGVFLCLVRVVNILFLHQIETKKGEETPTFF